MLSFSKKTLKIVFFLLVLCAAVALVGVQARGGTVLSVQTSSMVPYLQKGDLVTITHVPNSNLAVGDVVTFINPRNNKVTVTHRIVETPSVANGHKFITKGDANPIADTPIVPEAILGEVNLSLPLAGYAVDFVRQPVGLLLLIYVPALFIIIDEFKRLSLYYKKQRPYYSASLIDRVNKNRRTMRQNAAVAGKLSVTLVVVAGAVSLPVRASLLSQITLTSNTISAFREPSQPGPHVTFRKIVMRCSASNTVSKNVRPMIVIQNWTHQNFVANGWRVADNSGTIFTIPDGMEFKKLRQYRFTPYLADGLQYAGDRLSIINGQGQVVDMLSWGTDTTAFTPSVQGVTSGDRLERRPFHVDTDVAADWRVTDHRCWCPEQPDVEDGSDDGELGDSHESNRATVPGTYNLEEL